MTIMEPATTVKTTGAIWNIFYADQLAWPEGSYHDDTLLAIDGKERPDMVLDKLPLDSIVEIRSGYVMFPDGTDADLGEHFMKWQAKQSDQGIAIGSFRASKDKLQAVQQAILQAGGELIE